MIYFLLSHYLNLSLIHYFYHRNYSNYVYSFSLLFRYILHNQSINYHPHFYLNYLQPYILVIIISVIAIAILGRYPLISLGFFIHYQTLIECPLNFRYHLNPKYELLNEKFYKKILRLGKNFFDNNFIIKN